MRHLEPVLENLAWGRQPRNQLGTLREGCDGGAAAAGELQEGPCHGLGDRRAAHRLALLTQPIQSHGVPKPCSWVCSLPTGPQFFPICEVSLPLL